MKHYLFAHFVGEETDQEQIYFSVSKDGLHWEDLNDGKPVLNSNIEKKGVRDPFIVKDEKNNKYYLIATDLKVGRNGSWKEAEYKGSKNIIVWESSDLINWSDEWSVKVGIDTTGCVWAPESIYDKEKDAFLVFFASMVKEPGESLSKQRIYAAYTKDFRSFGETFKYIEKENHIIDTNIIESKGIYYRFSKDETTKTISMERGSTLDNDSFVKVDTPLLDTIFGLEGPECYELPDGKWCLIADQFSKKLGYLPIIISDLENPSMEVMSSENYDMGKSKKSMEE